MKKLLIILAFSLFQFPLVAFARPAAEVTDWYIKDFHSEITLKENSTLEITELITADCGNLPNKHGIFRTLPLFYQRTEDEEVKTPVELVSITDFNDQKLKYSTQKEDKTITWKIGDPDKTVTGENYYKISYIVKNVIRFNDKEFDELYWNLNGNFWDIETDNYTASIHFPPGINKYNTSLSLYTGEFGARGNVKTNSSWTGNVLKVETTQPLGYEGITLSATFPKNIISPYVPTFWERFGRFVWFLIPIFIFIFLYRYWAKWGRDPKINSAVAPEFEIPEKLSPLDMGMLYSNLSFRNQYMSASIINFAVKGYLKIEQIPKKGILTKEDYELIKLKDTTDELSASERKLFKKLFFGKEKTKISSLKDSFYKDIPDIKASSQDFLFNKGLYDKNSLNLRTYLLLTPIGFFFLITFLATTFGGYYVAAIVVSALITIIFGALMSRRTPVGAMLEHRIKGFKMYMDTAEKYRQEFNEKENIFEKLLPYAIMFGITKKWIKTMEVIYGKEFFSTYHPVWFYGPHLASFNVDTLASSIESVSTNMASTMASSPSSSGSGGGGFSGGGGGGGGGGGW